MDLREDIPPNRQQVAERLGRNAIARSFVSRAVAAHIMSPGSRLRATWDSMAKMQQGKPFEVCELIIGDHIAGAVGIKSLPTLEQCEDHVLAAARLRECFPGRRQRYNFQKLVLRDRA
jgi:hypothetical protein